MHRLPATLALACLIMVGANASGATAATLTVSPSDESTEYRFYSKATLESFEGSSSELSGRIEFDPTDLTTVRGKLVADLTKLDTGLGLRNKHMHDNVLDTKEHPAAIFTIDGGSEGSIASDGPVEFTLNGSMKLHGETKKLQAKVAATRVGNVVSFVAKFDLELAHFGIKRPKMLMMKVAETVQLTVKATATLEP